MSHWIQTYTGVRFDLEAPTPEMIRIEDIAHALALINRFAGHTREPYSVARHSIYVAEVLPPSLKLEGLLHDAAEAYLGDVTSPLKELLPDYRIIETRVEDVIRRKFNLPAIASHEVRVADLRLCATELRDLFDAPVIDSHLKLKGVEPYLGTVIPREWWSDEYGFVQVFKGRTI